MTLLYRSKAVKSKKWKKEEPNLEAAVFPSVGHRIAISRLKKFQLEPDNGVISAKKMIPLTRC